MPIYNARSTQVFLSTAPLDAATTKFRHNRQVPVASDNVQSDTEVFARAAESKTLIESAILDPASNSHMRFLGHHRDAPFFIVRAGTEPMPVQDDGGVSADDVRNGKSVRRQSRAISLAEIRNLQEVEHGRKRTRSQMGRDSGSKYPSMSCWGRIIDGSLQQTWMQTPQAFLHLWVLEEHLAGPRPALYLYKRCREAYHSHRSQLTRKYPPVKMIARFA